MRKAIGRSTVETDKFTQGTIWPIHPSYLASILSAPFAKDFYQDFQTIKGKIGLKNTSRLFGHPSVLWLMIMRTMPGLKIIGLGKRERIKIAKNILKMIGFLMEGNIYCEDGKNFIWSKEKTGEVVQNEMDNIQNNNHAVLLGRLHANLINFSQSIFWVTNCAHREIHGPYPSIWRNKKTNLIIREYFLLNPQAFDLKLKNFPIESISSYCLYKPEVKFNFAVLNDYSSNLPLNENLVAVGGKVKYKGKEVKFNDSDFLNRLCKLLEKENQRTSLAVNKLSEKEKAIGLIFRSYYLIRNIKKQLNKTWLPPKILIEKVKKDGVKKTLSMKGSRKEKAQRFLDLYDPRIDWPKK